MNCEETYGSNQKKTAENPGAYNEESDYWRI